MYTVNVYCNISREKLFEKSTSLPKTKHSINEFVERGCEGKFANRHDSSTCREQLSRFVSRTVTLAGLMKNPLYLLENSKMNLNGVGIYIKNSYSSQALTDVQQKNLSSVIYRCFAYGNSTSTWLKITATEIKMMEVCLSPENISAIYFIIKHARKTLSTEKFNKLTRDEILILLIKELLLKASKNGSRTTIQTCLFLWMLPKMNNSGTINKPNLMEEYNGASSYIQNMFNYTKNTTTFFRLISFIYIINVNI